MASIDTRVPSPPPPHPPPFSPWPEEAWREPVEPPADLVARWAAEDRERDAALLRALLDAEVPVLVPVLWQTLGRLQQTERQSAPGGRADQPDPGAGPHLVPDGVHSGLSKASSEGPDNGPDNGRPGGTTSGPAVGLAVGSGLEAEVREGERVDRMRAWARVAAYSQAMLMEQIAALHAVRDPAPHRHNPPARSAGGAAPGPAEGLASALFLPVEVAQALRLGARTAEHLVADAVALSARLPATADALRDGSIDAATARAIVDETALLTDQDVMATVEAAGLRRARTGGGTARAVRMHTRRQALRHDPANAARRVQAALGDVGVDKGDLLDGVGDLKVTLTAVDRAAVWTSLTDHAHAQRSTPGERRTLSQLRAAALVDLTTRPWLFTHPDTGDQAQADPTRDRDGRPLRLHRHPDHRHRDRHRDLQHRDHQHRDHRAADHEDGPATGTADEGMDQDTSKRPSTTTRSTRERSTRERSTRERSTSPPGSSPPRSRRSTGPWKVDVIVDLTTLLGANDDPALLVGHGLIPAAAARELAADGTWRRLVTDPLTGAVVERSTIRYRPTTTLADHVNARDQHCQMPGCRQPAGACDIDHRTSYRHGGTTCPDNLWALCRHHHRCKHSPGWTLTRHPGGATSVTTPTHHTYTAPPPTPWD